MEERDNCIEEITTLEEVDVITTGGKGTDDYNELTNKPSINDITLEGNKTLDDLNIQTKGDYALKSEIPDISELSAEVDSNTREIGFLDTRVTKLEEAPSGDFATEEYVNGKVQELVDGDIANLTELIKEDQDNIKTLQKTDIDRFDTSKPSGDGLLTINAVTKNNQNIQAFNIYNGLDAKYPYAAFGTQSAKELDERLKVLEEGGGSGESVPTYYFDGNIDSKENQDMLKEICQLVKDKKEFVFNCYLSNSYPKSSLINVYDTGGAYYFTFIAIPSSMGNNVNNYSVSYREITCLQIICNPNYDTFKKEENKYAFIPTGQMNKIIDVNNTKVWTPVQDYGLVHKKYVDDAIASASGGSSGDISIYYFNGDTDSEDNKNMFDEIIELIKKEQEFILTAKVNMMLDEENYQDVYVNFNFSYIDEANNLIFRTFVRPNYDYYDEDFETGFGILSSVELMYIPDDRMIDVLTNNFYVLNEDTPDMLKNYIDNKISQSITRTFEGSEEKMNVW